MSKRIGKSRRKTRDKYKKKKKDRGKISLTAYLQKFKKGEMVNLGTEPAVHKGMVYRRFMGKVGEIVSPQGKCYKIKIKDGNKDKMIIVHPIHLRKSGGRK